MGYKIGLYDRYNWSDMGPLFQWPKLNWVSLGLFHPEKKCWSFGPLPTDLGVQKTGFFRFCPDFGWTNMCRHRSNGGT